MQDVYLYNSLSRKKEKFEPLTAGFVGIYVCGPTVYGHSHLGHAKSYISFDIIVRYFRYLGYKVRYVQNITDVGHLLGDQNEGEDRVLKQARLEQLEPMEVVESYTRSYFEDMDRLGLIRPDISPRASGHIIEQIGIVKNLLEKNVAYEVDGNVYFDVHKFPGYGKLSGRKVEELEAGARVEVIEEKKHPADFALWKKAGPEHLMQWESPWGSGYPGWHLECSCMSTKYLGETFDIHGGGLENIFPHHECEIAQSEAAFGKPFARYWLHNNMITVDGVKMGKSLNNFITIKDALRKYHPIAIRYFVLMSHYRSALDFSDEALEAARRGLKKLQTAYERLSEARNMEDAAESKPLPTDAYLEAFHTAMNDDFNTPKAIAALFDIFNEVNKALDNKTAGKNDLIRLRTIVDQTAGDVLGIIAGTEQEAAGTARDIGPVVEVLLEIRNELRKSKNFTLSDKIRDGLLQNGIVIKDKPDGTTWSWE